jgi:hypothetical protein
MNLTTPTASAPYERVARVLARRRGEEPSALVVAQGLDVHTRLVGDLSRSHSGTLNHVAWYRVKVMRVGANVYQGGAPRGPPRPQLCGTRSVRSVRADAGVVVHGR